MSLVELLTGLIAYLSFVAGFAGAIQTGIQVFKPVLNQAREWLATRGKEELYLPVFYVVRLIVTGYTFFFVWGGVEPTREYLSFVPIDVPDSGIAVFTILLTVMGQEIIHPLIEKLYEVKVTIEDIEDVFGNIEIDPDPPSEESSESDRIAQPQNTPLG